MVFFERVISVPQSKLCEIIGPKRPLNGFLGAGIKSPPPANQDAFHMLLHVGLSEENILLDTLSLNFTMKQSLKWTWLIGEIAPLVEDDILDPGESGWTWTCSAADTGDNEDLVSPWLSFWISLICSCRRSLSVCRIWILSKLCWCWWNKASYCPLYCSRSTKI